MEPKINKPTGKNNFYEELKEYFKNTSKEQQLKDWDKSKHLDEVGPTVEEFLNIKRTFYRVGCTDTKQGLWYDKEGNFTGLIHTKFDFCKNKDLPMPYDENIKGYLSVVDELEDLFNWFTIEDIHQLNKFDYHIFKYEATNYKRYNNHWVICEKTSKIIKQL